MHDNDGPHDAEGNDLVAVYRLDEPHAEEFRESAAVILGGHIDPSMSDTLVDQLTCLATRLVAHVILG